MGFVSSIKDFIGGESEYDDYEDYEETDEYDEEPATAKRSFSRFSSRRDEDSREYQPESDITIIKVRKFDDSMAIADVLKTRRPVIFDVIEMDKSDDAERVVDFMVGVVYGLDGNIKRVSGGIFIATPKNMKINSDEIRKKTSSSLGFDL
ncbi:MAG: cell division protein SepF [Clostridia bacterium]|nr:cell division protein SepF [Clostridia bacterium]